MKKAADLDSIVKFLDDYCQKDNFKDFAGSYNGLQFENSGRVERVACAVDAGMAEFEIAVHLGANLLIAHHGMFWRSTLPFVGANYHRVKTLIDSDIAVYAMHLPLDAHSQIGNNALMAKALGLKKVGTCFECEGRDLGVVAEGPEGGLDELRLRLKKLFPRTYKEICFGSERPLKIALCSGSCSDVVELMPKLGIDTLICGELRERYFSIAQELNLNLFPCGHYATERFGVMALGEILAQKFGVDFKFIDMQNPL